MIGQDRGALTRDTSSKVSIERATSGRPSGGHCIIHNTRAGLGLYRIGKDPGEGVGEGREVRKRRWWGGEDPGRGGRGGWGRLR